ncbi:hypothetical protein A6R68_05342, partial [Neotoma lepida]
MTPFRQKGRMDLSRMKNKSLLGVKENDKKSSTRAPSPTKRKDCSDEKSKDCSKDKEATRESSEKDGGRDKTQNRRSASSGSSSTRSSSTSPSPSRHRHDNRWCSCSKSKPPKRDEKERKRQSPSPKPTKGHIGRLTTNVTKDHIMEIFSTFGKIKMIDMPVEKMHPHLSKGYAHVEFENPDEVEKALKHMAGGQIDGQEITATAVTPTDEEEVSLSKMQHFLGQTRLEGAKYNVHTETASCSRFSSQRQDCRPNEG